MFQSVVLLLMPKIDLLPYVSLNMEPTQCFISLVTTRVKSCQFLVRVWQDGSDGFSNTGQLVRITKDYDAQYSRIRIFNGDATCL